MYNASGLIIIAIIFSFSGKHSKFLLFYCCHRCKFRGFSYSIVQIDRYLHIRTRVTTTINVLDTAYMYYNAIIPPLIKCTGKCACVPVHFSLKLYVIYTHILHILQYIPSIRTRAKHAYFVAIIYTTIKYMLYIL